jgi:hypothetical protein
MTQSKATPGPWHLGVKQAEAIVYDSTGWAVANATVYHGESDREECRTNAHLIAAAPELRDALAQLLFNVELLVEDGTLQASDTDTHPSVIAARAILAKLEGE